MFYLVSALKVFVKMAARKTWLNFVESFLQCVEYGLDDHCVALVDKGELVWVYFKMG